MSLNSIFDYDYDFYFFTDDITDTNKFDTIYNKCTLPDPSGDRRNLIYNKCLEIIQLLSISPGFRVFSSFVNVDNKTYKVTVYNTTWSGEGLFRK